MNEEIEWNVGQRRKKRKLGKQKEERAKHEKLNKRGG